MTKTRIVSVTLLSLVTSIALAAGDKSEGQNNQGQSEHRPHDRWAYDQRAVSAPEIDPGQAMGALVLLGGTIAVIRGYRRKK